MKYSLKVEIWGTIFSSLKDCRRFWIVTYPSVDGLTSNEPCSVIESIPVEVSC